MFILADPDALLRDEIISHDAANEMRSRSRAAMIQLAVNAVLCFGIFAATGGLIFWLADAASVAVTGLLMLGGGLAGLSNSSDRFVMFGNAAVLIGAGLLIGGSALELVDKYEDFAAPILLVMGILIAAFVAWRRHRGALTGAFVLGTVLLMGIAVHLLGLGLWMEQNEIDGPLRALGFLYAASLLAVLGWHLDIRLITAIAIVPFAQMLDTGTGYFGAIYAFWSPESTLSILQMTGLMVLLYVVNRAYPERDQRHARVLAIMAFIIANLCALVGSLWGDVVGETLWGPGRSRWSGGYDSWDDWAAAREAFRESALIISAGLYSILWAIVLVGLTAFAAHRNNRPLFNASLTFAGIHGYTQLFESFGDEPLAWVIGGFGAIPLAWGLWRLNQTWSERGTENA